jgi:CO/xanthine dehydrogenase Mo-binding subunit
MVWDDRGRSVRRLEDARFLTGRGRYVADFTVAGEAHAHVLRWPHAHAVIERIDHLGMPATPERVWRTIRAARNASIP